MAQGGVPPPIPRWRARLDALLARPRVQVARSALRAYTSAGGGLLAAGLAYGALFALIPGILLILGIAGLVLGESDVHDAFVESVVAVVPPVSALLEPFVDELTETAGSLTLVGAVGLAWGASRFYAIFDMAMARVFGGTSQRGFVVRLLLGLLGVVVLGVAFGLMTVLGGLRAFIEAAPDPAAPALVGIAGLLLDLAGPSATLAAIALVYRLVPPRRPSWRAVVVPAVAVTLALLVLSRLFVFLAPRLIGSAAVLGTVTTVFAALAWLGLAFQAVLMGAAWIDAIDRELSRRRGAGGQGGPSSTEG